MKELSLMLSRNFFSLVVLTLLLSAFSAPARADVCSNPTLSGVSPTGGASIDLFESGSLPLRFKVNINADNRSCTIGLAISGRSFKQGGNAVPFVLKGISGSPSFIDDVSAPSIVTVAPDGQVDLQAILNGPVFAPAGEYTAPLQLQLFSNGASVGTPYTYNLPLSVKARAQVNIAGSSGSFGGSGTVDKVDFGDLQTGESRTVYVQLLSNADVDVSFSSLNGLKLQHVDPARQQTPIAYAAVFNGSSLPLTSPGARYKVRRSADTSLSGSSLPLTLTVGTVQDNIAGTYQDIITINVDTQ
jgi:hypothetical protein